MDTDKHGLLRHDGRARMNSGARASARFNVRHAGALDMPSPLSLHALKRRERRARLPFQGFFIRVYPCPSMVKIYG
jgi:hypothetical protein